MDNNKIHYSDLVSPDVQQGFESWIDQIKQLQAQSEVSIGEIKKKMEELRKQMTAPSGGGNIPKPNTQPVVDEIDKLRKVYENLQVDVKLYDDAIQALNKSERERKRVLQANTEIERSREDSYDRLSAQYTALKTLVNNMTTAEREQTDAGKKLVENLKNIYEQMDALQKTTGKYQLSVGKYENAVKGLNIATTQVIRELPALAVSPTTFAIAISNNIPILQDYILKVKESKAAILAKMAAAKEAGDVEAEAALKAKLAENENLSVTKLLVKSIFSWQSALVLVLTVLPLFLRNLAKKRKEQSEYNDVLKETIDLQNELSKADLKASQEGAKAATKAKTLYNISQDLNRSYEERIASATELKRLYPEYLNNVDAEAIVAGKAAGAYDKLTEALIRRAKAQVYLNKISETEEKKMIAITAKEKALAEAEKKNYDTYIVQSSAGATVARRTEEQARLAKETEINKITSEYDAKIKEYDNYMKELESRISGFGLLSDSTGSGAGGKDTKIGDYFFDLMNEYVNAMDDGLGKALAKLTLSYRQSEKKYEDARNELLEKQKTADAKEREEIDKQLTYINNAIIVSRTAYLKEREKLLLTEVPEVDEEFVDEEFVALKTQLEQEKALRDSAIYATYEAQAKSGKDLELLKKNTQDALLQSEIQYWKDYLQILKDSGNLTIEEYNKVIAKLMSLQGKTETTATKEQKRKKRKNYGGIFEIIAAYSDEYGEKDKNDNRKVQDKYIDYFKNIDKAMLKSLGYMKDWMETRVKMAEIAVESAKKEQDAAKTLLEYELEARANGFANNVSYARKEYEEKRKLTKKAAQDAQELARIQRAIDTAQQIQSLITATANIWSAEGKKGAAGIPLALAAIGAMWISFGAAKIRAEQLANAQTEQYGEGMSEYLNYGGSHASGHDIDFGRKPDGTRRRVERGEMIGVINKRNVNKYGVERVSDIISSLNHGTFEQSYGNAFGGNITMPQGADLHKLEKGVSDLVEQGGQKVVNVGGKTIMYYKNTKKIIRS
nr:MAG TPA: tail length tape measure protein [Caudoviricetes sp.]